MILLLFTQNTSAPRWMYAPRWVRDKDIRLDQTAFWESTHSCLDCRSTVKNEHECDCWMDEEEDVCEE